MSERHLIFLVHGQCKCGWECACPEGAVWPRCPLCGKQVLPPAPKPDATTAEERSNGRMGYFQATEMEALREARKRGYEFEVPVVDRALDRLVKDGET